MKIDTSKVTRVEIIDHQSEPTIGSGNFAKPMLGDAFHGIIEKLKGEIEFERKNNPDDCDRTSWGSQAGILISVVEAELLVKMYDEMNVQHP